MVQISKNLFSFLKCNDTFIQKAILYAKSLIFLQLPAKQIKREKEMTHKTLFFAQIYLPFVDTLATKNAMQYIVQCTKSNHSYLKFLLESNLQYFTELHFTSVLHCEILFMYDSCNFKWFQVKWRKSVLVFHPIITKNRENSQPRSGETWNHVQFLTIF